MGVRGEEERERGIWRLREGKGGGAVSERMMEKGRKGARNGGKQ